MKSSPKERVFIKKYIDTFNPINPSKKLMEHLDTIILPKSSYLNKETRGKKLLELSLDKVEYLFGRCEHCTSDIKLIARVVYYIKWYSEEIDDWDNDDIKLYEAEFREDFKAYNIDYDIIFAKECDSEPKETVIITHTQSKTPTGFPKRPTVTTNKTPFPQRS